MRGRPDSSQGADEEGAKQGLKLLHGLFLARVKVTGTFAVGCECPCGLNGRERREFAPGNKGRRNHVFIRGMQVGAFRPHAAYRRNAEDAGAITGLSRPLGGCRVDGIPDEFPGLFSQGKKLHDAGSGDKRRKAYAAADV